MTWHLSLQISAVGPCRPFWISVSLTETIVVPDCEVADKAQMRDSIASMFDDHLREHNWFWSLHPYGTARPPARRLESRIWLSACSARSQDLAKTDIRGLNRSVPANDHVSRYLVGLTQQFRLEFAMQVETARISCRAVDIV